MFFFLEFRNPLFVCYSKCFIQRYFFVTHRDIFSGLYILILSTSQTIGICTSKTCKQEHSSTFFFFKLQLLVEFGRSIAGFYHISLLVTQQGKFIPSYTRTEERLGQNNNKQKRRFKGEDKTKTKLFFILISMVQQKMLNACLQADNYHEKT